MAQTWHTARGSDLDTTQIGHYTVSVWTGSPDHNGDNGYQVCSVYIPRLTPGYPDGLLIVGRRKLDTKDRTEAREQALDIARAAIAAHEGTP